MAEPGLSGLDIDASDYHWVALVRRRSWNPAPASPAFSTAGTQTRRLQFE